MDDLPEKRLHPEKWRHDEDVIKLEKDEKVAMIMEYEVTDEKERASMMFIVTCKNKKAIAKNIIKHIGRSEGQKCEGHATKIAEYDISEVKELVKETRKHGAMIALMMLSDETSDVKPDEEKALILLTPPEPHNQTELRKNSIESMKDPEMEQEEKIRIREILKTLSTSPEKIEDTKEIKEAKEKMIMTMKIAPLSKKEKNDKKSSEKTLIKKYGKKNIEKLAKNIKYKGILINNKKTK